MTISWWNWDIERIRKNGIIFTGKITLDNLKRVI